MDGNFLVFEYVAPEFHPATEYLHAADKVMAKLSADTRQILNRPIPEHLFVRFGWEDYFDEFMLARIRCALAMEAVGMAVQGLVLGFKNIQPRAAMLDSRQRIFIVGCRCIPVGMVLARMRHEAGVPGPVAKEVWQSIVAVLLDGKISVPGLWVKSPLDP